MCVPLYHLLRLQLASARPAELAPAELAGLVAHQHLLWKQLHTTVQAHYRVSAARARELVEQLLMNLLLEDCCRQALRRAVPLAEALGLAQAIRWNG